MPKKNRPEKKDPNPPPRFTADDLVIDVLERHPGVKDVLLSFGLPCFKCIVAERETLREGCAPLHMEVDGVLERLNALPPHPEERPRP